MSHDRYEWIYWGDSKMWSLTPTQRHALRFGRITPREARELYDLAVLQARVRPWWIGYAA